LGCGVGHTTILRSVKKSARIQRGLTSFPVAGIDDWAWKKGMKYGTIIVDLERRQASEKRFRATTGVRRSLSPGDLQKYGVTWPLGPTG
jgi:hypothetical protein